MGDEYVRDEQQLPASVVPKAQEVRGAPHVAALLALQRSAGNRAVVNLCRRADSDAADTRSGRRGPMPQTRAVGAVERSAGNRALASLFRQVADVPAADWPEQETAVEESASEESEFDEAAVAKAEREGWWQSVKEGAAGLAYGTVQGVTPGGFMAPSPAPGNRTFEFFRGAGQFATGVATIVGGAAGEVGGALLDLTGIGAPAGVAVNVGSAVVIAQGVTSTAAGAKTLLGALQMSGTPQARWLPKKGTPERAKAEADRREGIRKRQQAELDDIRNGGKGSGVWTDAELETIRKTGKFPKDVRWHHDPPVALRPDLAADPKVVRPVRGGHAGHLAAHGGDFRPK